VSHDIRELFV